MRPPVQVEAPRITLETLKERIADELKRGPVDVASFVDSYSPNAYETGLLLARGFHVGIFRGRLDLRGFECEGHISKIADDTRPVWH